ncbi:mRNA decay activator protein ZFP36L1 [Misgurnus anguillicaudatus]|uniref:mRNA decay activator protein ZFP36L1 n=1 Tax=Misgurnus anguillicaudatus TaxID=75329 RepID=UPI0024352AE6|nr:mRNA decay activator protein ZFP36L1 [Misgurnus anguillicaudatus]
MPSNFLTPFLELDDEFCKSFRSIDLTDGAQQQRTVGFQRRHSLCPVTLPNSKFNDNSPWPLQGINWNLEQKQQLPRSSLNHIPFRVDRSVSMIEGHVSSLGPCEPTAPLAPPPGLSISNSSLSSPKSLSATTTPMSTRYKTELCRTYEESGTCKYGAKCQFAHGMEELRGLNRHPKYKTEPCRTFHTIGFCPYGARCHFIHNADEMQGNAHGHKSARERPQLLRQSVSFSGFSSQALTGFHAVPDALAFSRSSSVSPPPSTGSPDLLSPLFPEPGSLKHSYPFADVGSNDAPRFCAITDSKFTSSCAQNLAYALKGLTALQRSASADSLSDQEGYSSSSSLSGCDSPDIEGRRLPIFSRLSVSDD